MQSRKTEINEDMNVEEGETEKNKGKGGVAGEKAKDEERKREEEKAKKEKGKNTKKDLFGSSPFIPNNFVVNPFDFNWLRKVGKGKLKTLSNTMVSNFITSYDDYIQLSLMVYSSPIILVEHSTFQTG